MTRTRPKPRKNPELGPLTILARARELLTDPDPGSMPILLDMLEEQNVSLYEIGEKFAPGMAPNMSNEMAIAGARRGEVGYFELEMRSLNNRVGVAWSIKPESSDSYVYLLRLWINWRGVLWSNDSLGSTLPLEISGEAGEHGDFMVGGEMERISLVPHVNFWITDTRQAAVTAAWRVAVVLKRLLPRTLDAMEVMRELADHAKWSGSPRAWRRMGIPQPSENVLAVRWDPIAPRQNPAKDKAQIAEELRGLLLDRDAASVTVIQDLLIEHGMTLSELVAIPNLATEEMVSHVVRSAAPGDPPLFVGAIEVTPPRQYPRQVEYVLPSFWASYLNGDASGMSDDEIATIELWLGRQKPGHVINVSEDTWFSNRNDASNMAGDVATFTFLKYPERPTSEGAGFYVNKTESGRKFYAYVIAMWRGEEMQLPVGHRSDSQESAIRTGALLSWLVAATLKLHRDDDETDLEPRIRALIGTDDLKEIHVPDEIVFGKPVGTVCLACRREGEDKKERTGHTCGKPSKTPGEVVRMRYVKDNPPRRTRSVEEQVAANRIRGKFIELLQDPDPGALDAARDLLLENGVKLADLAHSLALNGASNWSTASRGWASDDLNTGELVLRGEVEGDVSSFNANKIIADPDYIAVSWMIWKTIVRRSASTPTASTTAWTSEIQINYRGAQWIENRNGARGNGLNDERPIGIFGGSSVEVAQRRTIDMAWQICRVLKMYDGVPAQQIVNALRDMPTMPKTPPALINPAHLRPNPPWVTHALADAFESLTSQVRAEWLPQLDNVHGGPRGTLVAQITEYGCGAYGCVLPTLDSSVVLKVTTDQTEADFASQIAADLVDPICVEYYMAVSLAKRHEGRPIYLLWRESADDVGALEEALGSEAADLVEAQHRLGQAVYKALFEKRIDEAKVLLREWQVAAEAMAKEPELAQLAHGLVRAYRDQGVFFGDIHAGNLGRVYRGSGSNAGVWVITDPGHVAVLR